MPIGVILAIIGISLPLIVALGVFIVKKLYEVSSAVNVLNALLTALTDRVKGHEEDDDSRFDRHDQRMRDKGV